MSSHPEALKLLPALAIASLLIAGCEGERVAGGGTATTTGNTITALVLGPDKAPVAGARIILRPMGYVPDTIGISESSGPGSRLDTVTDSAGRFTFKDLDQGNYLIECSRDLPKATLVSWTENVFPDPKRIRDLGSLQLDTAAALTGRTIAADSAGTDNLWAGFPGTERFYRLGPDLRFTLPVFPEDRKAFTLYRKRPAGDWQQITVGGWKFKETELPPGSPPILEPFTLPGLESKDTAIKISDTAALPDTVKSDAAKQAGFCPEAGPATLVRDRAAPLPHTQKLRVRTVLSTTPPQLIELDPCAGSWRNLQELPSGFSQPYLSFSSRQNDFVLQPDFKTYFRYAILWATNAASTNSAAAFSGITGVVNHQGKFHVLYGGNEVGIFADTSFLHGGAAESRLPLQGAPAGLAGIAYLGEVMYSLSGGPAQTPLFRYDPVQGGSRYEAINGLDAASTAAALAKASESALWVLTDKNQLLLWDANAGITIKTYVIEAPAPARTLTRYPD